MVSDSLSVVDLPHKVIVRDDLIIYGKRLEQGLEHSRCSINVGCKYSLDMSIPGFFICLTIVVGK